MYILETERLRLRKMTMDDVDNLLLIFSDPIAMQYYPSTMDRNEAIEWIKRFKASYQDHGIGLWIVERKEDARFIGQCGLSLQKTNDAIETEIGYLFAREFWGHGYATEAARACRDWGFENLDVPRLVSIISIYNTPSINVAKRNGMSLASNMIKPSGIPHHVYSISREDWLKR